MRRDTPAVRILPMSDKAAGFRGRGIEYVQRACFLRELPAMKGRYRYPSSGLNAEPGTIVLFQYRARIIASAIFLRDEKFERPIRGYGGAMYFDPRSFRTFDPLDVEAMRRVWPSFIRWPTPQPPPVQPVLSSQTWEPCSRSFSPSMRA